MRNASSKLFIVAALGLMAPLAAYQPSAASACPFAQAQAADTRYVDSIDMPGGPALFDAARVSPAIFP